jgi:hypothetical protein
MVPISLIIIIIIIIIIIRQEPGRTAVQRK